MTLYLRFASMAFLVLPTFALSFTATTRTHAPQCHDKNPGRTIFTTAPMKRCISSVQMSFDGGAGELTSALATLDRQWELTSRKSKGPTAGIAGWTKLILEPKEEEQTESSYDYSPSGSSGYTAAMDQVAVAQAKMNQQEEFVYLLEPPTSPSLILFFLGGAGLGQFPHIAYSQLLSRISRRLNAAIITAPYPLSLDHFELSKTSGEALRRASVQCEEKGGYSPDLPKFYLGHSLGSKLLAIQLAASGVRDAQGIGFMSYNNFGFSNTISMVKEFADDLNQGDNGAGNSAGAGAGMGAGMNGIDLDQILDFAGQAVNMMGFEFNPSPETMDRIVEMKYDGELQKKTRLFMFDNDDLDSGKGFIKACENAGTSGPAVVELEGKHLSPVFLKLGIDDLEVPDEARQYVDEASRGFQSASFGDEDKMNGAVNAVCDWIMGK